MWMFTGIVSAVGTVIEVGPHRLGIEHAATARRLKRGGSVAVNGCCLTVIKKSRNGFFADVVPETLRRTNLGALKVGSQANLELPVAPDGLLDGHLVQGHVDATTKIRRIKGVVAGREAAIDMPKELRQFLVEKGSIALDGMSLTIAKVDDIHGTFTVALIPHTLAVTIAGAYEAESVVNLEADIVARYVARNLRR
jgi:riboflavin synthase